MEKVSIEDFNQNSSRRKYFSIIESLLYVSGEPLKLKSIASIIECDIEYTKSILKDMMDSYAKTERGIKLISINDEYQLVTKSENSSYVQKLLKTNSRQSLSQASLEALAIIAYKQPVTRIEIDEIRGVKSDRAVIGLKEKNLIKESGRLEAPGRPILYSTTDEFLRYFDLNSLKSMPELDSFFKDEEIEK
ncbi:MAG: SMC-Scp complex subunit ScpB [Clostridium sp.]|nr:SMC-Scp complex subunit ScpB [Clostridium sp.]